MSLSLLREVGSDIGVYLANKEGDDRSVQHDACVVVTPMTFTRTSEGGNLRGVADGFAVTAYLHGQEVFHASVRTTKYDSCRSSGRPQRRTANMRLGRAKRTAIRRLRTLV
jgi:hypothetical protein